MDFEAGAWYRRQCDSGSEGAQLPQMHFLAI